MKTFVSILILLIFSTATYSQTTKIDMYDAIKLLIPDSSNPQQLGKWNNIPLNSESYKWGKYYCLGEICTHNATLKLNTIPKTVAVFDDNPLWMVDVYGKKEGYKKFKIHTLLDYQGGIKNALKDLIGEKKYQATLYKKFDKAGVTYAYYIYQFHIPGKNTVWLELKTGEMNNGNREVTVTCYLTLKSITDPV